MMTQFFLIVFLSVLAIPVVILTIQILSAVILTKKLAIKSTSKRPSLAILMPAHNEALVITDTIKALLTTLNSGDRLLVVADNCTDATANIARSAGATVIERQHLTLRGKGYALDYGLQYLKNSPPEVLIIIDADCHAEGEAISALANACKHYQRPVQALYLMHAQPNPSLKQRIAAFAWIVKNKVRPLGFHLLGLPCQLMGTGMAFLWKDMMLVNLASGHIAEDMKLGVDLARIGQAPVFLPQSLVTSIFPSDQGAVKTQRARWEHGHLSVIVTDAPGLFLEALKARNMQMLGLALDLIVPPLAILALISALAFVMSLLIHQMLPIQYVVIYAALILATLSVAILIAWLFFGRHIINFKQLCYAPIYALIKIPLYIKFFVNRQVEWVRSKRD